MCCWGVVVVVQKFNLLHHMHFGHFQHRRFLCAFGGCGKAFSTKQLMQKHFKAAHEYEDEESSPEKHVSWHTVLDDHIVAAFVSPIRRRVCSARVSMALQCCVHEERELNETCCCAAHVPWGCRTCSSSRRREAGRAGVLMLPNSL